MGVLRIRLLSIACLVLVASVSGCGLNEVNDANGHYVFDGSVSGVGTFIGTGNGAIHDWAHTDWSISAWVKPNPKSDGAVSFSPIAGTYPAVTNDAAGGNHNYTLLIGFRFDGATNTDFVIANGAYHTAYAGSPYPPNTYDYGYEIISSVTNVNADSDPSNSVWAFYVVTYSASSAVYHVWRNGQPLTLNAAVGVNAAAANGIAGKFGLPYGGLPSPLTIGAAGLAATASAAGAQFFDGRMDDIRVWDSIELNDNQVSSLYCTADGGLGSHAPPEPQLYLNGNDFGSTQGATTSSPAPVLSGSESAVAGANQCYGACPNVNSTYCVVKECVNGFLSFDILRTGLIVCDCIAGYSGVTCETSTVTCADVNHPCSAGFACVNGLCEIINNNSCGGALDPLCVAGTECISGVCRPTIQIRASSAIGTGPNAGGGSTGDQSLTSPASGGARASASAMLIGFAVLVIAHLRL